ACRHSTRAACCRISRNARDNGYGDAPVKCPKCDYLGFETGDRCKNCGYDFSLLSIADSDPPDYDIYPAAVDDVPVHVIDDMGRHDRWLDNREEPLGSRLFLDTSPRDDVDEALDDTLTSSLTPESPF